MWHCVSVMWSGFGNVTSCVSHVTCDMGYSCISMWRVLVMTCDMWRVSHVTCDMHWSYVTLCVGHVTCWSCNMHWSCDIVCWSCVIICWSCDMHWSCDIVCWSCDIVTETNITNTATVQVTVVYSNDIHAETKKVYLEIKNYISIASPHFNCKAVLLNFDQRSGSYTYVDASWMQQSIRYIHASKRHTWAQMRHRHQNTCRERLSVTDLSSENSMHLFTFALMMT